MTALKRMRETRGMSRREISEQCGINLRSLQDYEQGHKDISRANGALLYKLALALGCHIEEILDPYLLSEAKSGEEDRRPDRAGRGGISSGKRGGIRAEDAIDDSLRKRLLESGFRSERYMLCGRWAVEDGTLMIVFAYGGEIVKIPFPGLVTDQTMPWLPGAAVMLMEGYVEDMLFMRAGRDAMEKSGAEAWDEW